MKSTHKKKRIVNKRVTKNKLHKGGAKNGALYAIAILAIAATFGGMMTGGAIPQILKLQLPPPPGDPYSCCDTGNGANCHPIVERQIQFNGAAYGLLKSKIFQAEGGHIAPAELAGFSESVTPDGHKIFINTSDHTANYPNRPGCEPGKDLIGIKDPSDPSRHCFGVPDDELIYVCSDTVEECNKQVNKGKVPFDVYFRLSDGDVPSEIANFCPKPQQNLTETPQRIVGLPTPSGTANLQLETFWVEQDKVANNWLGAWCKPADYFYPTEKTDIQFDVKPQGQFTHTIPQHQAGGWNFTASPDGNLLYQGKNYPYIYWDAAIPNNLITKPQTGYAVAYKDLSTFLNNLLPKMGLNQKETSEFITYWVKQLPSSNYYYVGIIPRAQIDSLAPLTINPAPTSILRVSLYFEPLKEKVNVTAPQIEPFVRSGFTVVEWGAIFDTQKHPGFSCLM